MIQCDIKTCVGCRMCEVACSSFHSGAVSPALSRIRVAKIEETGLDLAIACLSCVEKTCLECPTEALSAGGKGQILLNLELCGGCKVCVDLCPIGAVGFHDGQPLFCDLCGGATSCVNACPSRALSCPENHGGISLQSFRRSVGNPGHKRAVYARARGEALRESWKKGARVDS
jgi:anaerobic carbon-monoxide dehydrogenase iron sulfur subunit